MFVSLENTRYMQYLAAITATLTMTSSATYLTWPSPSLPKLQSIDSPIGVQITDEEGSWMISLYLLVSLPFTFVGGWLAEKIGRKLTLLLGAIALALPWIVIIFANSAIVLYVARSMAGIGLSLATIGCSMYNAEISDTDIRGRLGMIFIVMMLAGNLIVFCAGPFISYTALALVCMSIPVFFVLVFYFMPESPYWLVRVGRIEEAKKVLRQIAPRSNDNEYILKKIKDIEVTLANDANKKSNIWELLTNKQYRSSVIAIIGVKTLQQFSGLMAIEPYMQTIIELSQSSITPEISSIIFGFVQVPAVLFATMFVDRLGRKPLLIISAMGCAIALLGEGTYFFMQDYLEVDVNYISWLPTLALVVFLIMKSLGITTLPYVLLGELFASNIKELAVSSATFYGGILAFIMSKFFKPLSLAIGIYSVFWMFAVSCTLGSIFVYFFLPETKGKSFADIQTKLRRNIKSNNIEQPISVIA